VDTVGTRSVSLSIVIVNWNGGERRDGSMQALTAARDAVEFNGCHLTIIENEENTGFSRANNLAIRHSQGDLGLLNVDTVVTPGAIDSLVRTLVAGCAVSGDAATLVGWFQARFGTNRK
jgi:hypothetical protein